MFKGMRGAAWALSGCLIGRVRWRDEEIEIALLSWSSFPSRGHQLRSALVFRFQWSLRDIEELLFERGVIVTYAPKEVRLGDETIRCWCEISSARAWLAASNPPDATPLPPALF